MRITRLQSVLLAVLMVLALILPRNVTAAPPPQQPPPAVVTGGAAPQSSTQGAAWFDGGIQYSSITNCWSIIQGMPYQENGAGTYVGFYANPSAPSPVPNTPYYVHVVVYGLGNSCSGQYAYIEVALPSNTAFAITPGNPVRCYNKNGAINSSECPQVPSASGWNPGFNAFLSPLQGGVWPLPQGNFIELQIPVVSSTALSGAAFQANVWMLDGNSSPWLRPTQGVYVFSGTASTPSIGYPSPSTVVTTTRDLLSTAYLYTYGTGGSFTFDVGTTTAYGFWSDAGTVDPGVTWWLVWENWLDGGGNPVLAPDTQYHWRLRYTPTGGATIYGADQTFRTAADGRVVIGTGSPGGCNESAFNTAMSTVGLRQIAFDCGAVPVTVTVSTAKNIGSYVTIDGGHKVTLAGAGTSNLFNLQTGSRLTLRDITLANGNNAGNCGGAVRVMSGAMLESYGSQFRQNSTGQMGGALCVEAGGSAAVYSSQFISNAAATGGGGIYNAGIVEMMWSDISGNSTPGDGGGVKNTGSFWATTSALIGNSANNGSSSRGGGLYDSGTDATLTNSTVSSNFANYGGGISSGGAAVLLTNVTIAANAGDPGAGAGIGRFTAAGGLESTNLAGSTQLRNVLLAGNWPGNCATSSIFRLWTSVTTSLDDASRCGFGGAPNLSNANAKLTGLGNYGGTTRTHALWPGSAAIDAASDLYCAFYDQRGFMGPNDSRAVDGNGDGVAHCDIGAFEYRPTIYLPFGVR